jgi:4-aminobutyrate aminotransferase-like enzyme
MTDRSVHDLLARRAGHLSSSLSILYDTDPIHVVRGSGQYLYDADGREYLDCMNNVPHVGHSHPRVTDAICRQLRMVNTNTRFLYEPLVDYADRLTAQLPDPLRVCFFVNSGSEANELALRMIRTHTGRSGITVQDGAYHGNTSGLVDISPYKFNGRGGLGKPDFVEIAPTPDPYRGPYRGPDSASGYVRDVAAAIGRSAAGGFGAAAFVAETLMGTAGQIVPPGRYLPGAYQAARERGALTVADEVQIGFGRVGSHMWAFETQDVVPDIVTLGKPIGNSYPLGAVVTTPEVADSFANGMEYFNTFGGSPVACAAGLAVLDVLEEEQLQHHARDVGAHLLQLLTQLQHRHYSIGDVRGLGLFIGVELVRDRELRTPDGELAAALVLALRHEGILLSTDGPDHNVLKIKPPLPFSTADADRLADAIDRFLERTAP